MLLPISEKEGNLIYSVLIVDDEPVICEGMRDMIPWRDHDMQVIAIAYNGRSALELVHKIKPDIVFTDIIMPYMDGLELARNISTMYPQIRIIIISAYQNTQYFKSALKIGAIDFLVKPFNKMEIAVLLNKLASSCQLVKENHNQIQEFSINTVNDIEGLVATHESLLISACQTKSIDEIKVQIEQIFKILNENGIRSVLFTLGLCINILDSCTNVEENESDRSQYLNQIMSCHNIDEMRVVLTNALIEIQKNTPDESTIYARKVITRIDAMMKTHYSENLTIKKLADHVFLSTNYVSSLYKQQTGKTINEMMTTIRIIEAKKLLRQKNATIQAVALSVGYKDVKHFNYVFKRIIGITPLEFRDMH